MAVMQQVPDFMRFNVNLSLRDNIHIKTDMQKQVILITAETEESGNDSSRQPWKKAPQKFMPPREYNQTA